MTTTLTKPKENILKSFEGLTFAAEPSYTSGIRAEALEALNKLDFPTLRNEDWKYTKVSGIVKNEYHPSAPSQFDITPYIIPEADENRLVFINGFFMEGLSIVKSSSENLIIGNIIDAEAKHPDLFKKYFAKKADHQNQVFTALNTAWFTGGAFIYVKDKAVIDRTIHIINIVTGDKTIAQPRNLIIAGKHSQAKMIMTFEALDAKTSFVNAVTEIFVDENAHLAIDKLQNENAETSHISTEQVYQEVNSNFTINTITLNGGLVRNSLNIVIDAENCESNLNGLYILDENQHVDNHTLVDHKKPHCQSNELYKGIMSGKSTGVFNGKVFVRQDAQKTNAFQSNKNILLSDDATINTKPELEIYADDVKCSHGSTTGQMDDDAVFYLQARGIGKDSAMRLLMTAFASDVLEKIKSEPLREKIENLIEEKLG
jgi:Fe-S cluster assembly protein SufD